MHVLSQRFDPSLSVRGFSLVELLAVITIIAALLGMLLPALKMVREGAKVSKCQSNLRQVGVALVAYTNDNEGFLPWSVYTNTTGWTNSSGPLVQYHENDTRIYRCPSYTYAVTNRTLMANTYLMYFTSYTGILYDRIRSKPEKILIADSANARYYFDNVNWPYYSNLGTWHRGKTGILFSDYHAGSMVRTDVVPTTNVNP